MISDKLNWPEQFPFIQPRRCGVDDRWTLRIEKMIDKNSDDLLMSGANLWSTSLQVNIFFIYSLSNSIYP